MNNEKISVSILNSDLSNIEAVLKQIEYMDADYVHYDVMDGVFVGNITFGPDILKCAKKKTDRKFDVHLMIQKPEKHIKKYIDCGADIITFHIEATDNVDECIKICKENGVKCAISVKPNTDISVVYPYLSELDMVLIMTVEPGYGGQGFLNSCAEKIKTLKDYCNTNNIDIDIEVDGGINDETAKVVKENGANILVSGTYLFKSNDMREAIKKLY